MNLENLSSKKKSYFCKSCGKNDSETKFYDYLTTKCSDCKKKDVKDSRESKTKEVREEKINQIDPDERIRYLWSEMMKEPFYRNGKKSVLDFMEETEQDISDLVMSGEKVKLDCLESINDLKEKINTIFKFQEEIEKMIDLKIENKIMERSKSFK
jgi:hypothetical protein